MTSVFRSHLLCVGSCAGFRRMCVDFGQAPGRDSELNYSHCILKPLSISSM